MNKNNKIVFFGTPGFAVPALEMLIEADYEIAAVVTTPDKPAGRDNILTPPPVKIAAQKYELAVLQPEKIRNNSEFFEQIKSLAASAKNFGEPGAPVGVLAAYGKIIPKEIIEIFSRGIINIHPSLLPKYRGSSPIQYALLNGDREIGITIMKLDEEIDHGPVLAQEIIKILPDEKFPELNQRLAGAGAKLLVKTLGEYLAGKIEPKPQNHVEATFTKIIKKEDGKADWTRLAEEIYNKFRAFYPWPGLWIIWHGKMLKITDCKPESLNFGENIEPGKLVAKDKKIFFICGQGVLHVKSLQIEGGKILSASQFLSGYGKNLQIINQKS